VRAPLLRFVRTGGAVLQRKERDDALNAANKKPGAGGKKGAGGAAQQPRRGGNDSFAQKTAGLRVEPTIDAALRDKFDRADQVKESRARGGGGAAVGAKRGKKPVGSLVCFTRCIFLCSRRRQKATRLAERRRKRRPTATSGNSRAPPRRPRRWVGWVPAWRDQRRTAPPFQNGDVDLKFLEGDDDEDDEPDILALDDSSVFRSRQASELLGEQPAPKRACAKPAVPKRAARQIVSSSDDDEEEGKGSGGDLFAAASQSAAEPGRGARCGRLCCVASLGRGCEATRHPDRPGRARRCSTWTWTTTAMPTQRLAVTTTRASRRFTAEATTATTTKTTGPMRRAARSAATREPHVLPLLHFWDHTIGVICLTFLFLNVHFCPRRVS